jgi:hypothetical protein
MTKVDTVRHAATAALLVCGLSLGACAHTKTAQSAKTCPDRFEAERVSTGALLQTIYPDPRKHHAIVYARGADETGDVVLDMTVWPLSQPQEPAPGHKVRLVMQACSLKPISATKLPD